jgi:hypothetical protein
VPPEPRRRTTRRRANGKITIEVTTAVHHDGTVDVLIDEAKRTHLIGGAVDINGRVTSYTITARDGGAVTTADLRAAGGPEVLRLAAAAARSGVLSDRMFGAPGLAEDARSDFASVLRKTKQLRLDRERLTQSRKHSGTRLRGSALEALIARAASTYREQLATGDPAPRRTTARALGYSENYVGRLLGFARERGLLGPAPGPGQAGEASPPRPRTTTTRKGRHGSTK